MSAAALLTLVGPSEYDLERLDDLLAAVVCYEPDIRICVLVDDGREDRASRLTALAAGRLPVVVLRHPGHRRSERMSSGGAPATGTLAGLAWVHAHCDVEFVLKIDLDALIIAPFHQRISSFLRVHADAGVVGCIGETCDRAASNYQACEQRPSRFAVALQLLETLQERVAALVPLEVMEMSHPVLGTIWITPERFKAVSAVRARMRQAVANGQCNGQYVQGGAYVLSGEMLRRMHRAGVLGDALDWMPVPYFNEDEIISMYSFVTGMRLYDYSNDREPFGIAYRGLPFAPAELVTRDHALIHSLKEDARHTEADIRRFFARRRSIA